MSKPLPTTKGIFSFIVFVTLTLTIVSIPLAGFVAYKALTQPRPTSYASGNVARPSATPYVEALPLPTTRKVTRTMATATPTQPPKDRGINCYLDGKVYRLLPEQCVYLKEFRNYSLDIQNTKYQGLYTPTLTVPTGAYGVNPNIGKDAATQMSDQVNNIDGKIISPPTTPNPCSNLQGIAQISGGSCN